MRNIFTATLEKLFVVPADTFDNVKGKFPIGFQIYDTKKHEVFQSVLADVFDANQNFIGTKEFSTFNNAIFLNKWLATFKDKKAPIARLNYKCNDFQHQNRNCIIHFNQTVSLGDGDFSVSKSNLIIPSIYLAIRHAIEATWLNDRDQFLYPNDGWQTDSEFQNDCLAYTLFSNNIQSHFGINHWQPFTEYEVNARTKFDSNFMTDFISGKLRNDVSEGETQDMHNLETTQRTTPLVFSAQAQAVFGSGKALWLYFHQQPNCNVNASYYDIREHFQGRNAAGKMNNKSDNATYMGLIKNLREQLKLLQKNIEPKIYEYKFLK